MFLAKQALATAVLSLIQFQLGDEFDELNVEPYINGRECGWAVMKFGPQYSPKVVFSENRNSDSIVLYSGRHQDFSMQGNTPDEHVYKSARYYDAVDVWQCVSDVIAVLQQLNAAQ